MEEVDSNLGRKDSNLGRKDSNLGMNESNLGRKEKKEEKWDKLLSFLSICLYSF